MALTDLQTTIERLSVTVDNNDLESILGHATSCLEQTSLLYKVSVKENDRRIAKSKRICKPGGIAVVGGATWWYASAFTLSILGALAAIGGALACVGAGYLYWNSDYLQRRVRRLVWPLHRIWFFVKLLYARRNGIVNEHNAQLAAFVGEMEEKYEISVLQDWMHPTYAATFLSKEMDGINSVVVEIMDYVRWGESWIVGDNIPKLAVLIDAENARSSVINQLLSEIAKYGTAHAKRAYGDWTKPHLQGWKGELLEQSIQPIQQFAYTHGKNATDSAMIIDAMDHLYSSRYDGFCLVSSDSDFTRLAARIRESGLTLCVGLSQPEHSPSTMLFPSVRNVSLFILGALVAVSHPVSSAHDVSEPLDPLGPLKVTLGYGLATTWPQPQDVRLSNVKRNWQFSSHIVFANPVGNSDEANPVVSDGQL
ncbi:hypothetical protein ETB97_002246 [Aspergillus alliaceus]|uniref:NYN domain-containing protein n=1 Tax=Petromyces alliaceus TaxID=209559 RepID=A0A8H6A2Y3_PETAA|nr:hypothetical protein ETB97_002246 [Aspergillus burnettii]